MDKIKGPLEIWPFPILNALIAISQSRPSEDQSSSNDLMVTEIRRDDEGRITSIEEFSKE